MTGDLHVFHDGEDWYIARDLADCFAAYEEQTGDEPYEPEGWAQLPDDSLIRIVCNEDGEPDEEGDPVELTCAEWCLRIGRGLLCCKA